MRHGMNNKAARQEVEAVKGCRRQPEAMGEWIGRREDTTVALGQSRGRISSEEESVTSRLVFLLGRRLGGVAARWRLWLKAVGSSTHQTNVVKHVMRSSWSLATMPERRRRIGSSVTRQGEVEETKCTTVYRLLRFGHAGTGGGKEHSGSVRGSGRAAHRFSSCQVDSGLRYRKREESSREDTCLAQASPQPSAGSSFKLREEAVGRWQCSSRYGKRVEAEFIETTKMCPRLWSCRWVEMTRLIHRKVIIMFNGNKFTRETLLYAAGTRIPGRFFGG
ncbi:hypothetical protein B0H14DRAFT_3159326 [Mycena olivaceomarginata]|nr:hypothetical protein B0H14DRAFT_3159326 [Mycena olivaceomarginata]